jgi:hypothetical protein
MNERTWTRRQTLQGVAASLLCGTGLSALGSGNRLVLGQSAAFTGPAAQLGIQMNLGARTYFDAASTGGPSSCRHWTTGMSPIAAKPIPRS